jgi:hypothetical protein
LVICHLTVSQRTTSDQTDEQVSLRAHVKLFEDDEHPAVMFAQAVICRKDKYPSFSAKSGAGGPRPNISADGIAFMKTQFETPPRSRNARSSDVA